MIGAGRMKIFSVMLNPKEEQPLEEARYIPEGFHFFAFLFTGFWALSHRMWWMAVLFFSLHMGSRYFGAAIIGLSPQSVMILELGFRVMIGLSASDLWRMSLERKGWVVSEVIIAYNELEAMHRYVGKKLGTSKSGEQAVATGAS